MQRMSSEGARFNLSADYDSQTLDRAPSVFLGNFWLGFGRKIRESNLRLSLVGKEL